MNLFSSRRLANMLLLVVGLLVLAASTVDAFTSTAPSLSSLVRSRASASSSTARFYTEENEWYSQTAATTSTTSTTAANKPTETVIESPEQLRSFLFDHPDDDRLIIVKYHASWCKSCARYKLHLDKLLAKHPGNKIRYASVEWGANTALCHQQRVVKLPTTRLYANKWNDDAENVQLVQQFETGPKGIQRVSDAVDYYLNKIQRQQRRRKQKQQQQQTEDEQRLEATLDKGKDLVSAVLLQEQMQQQQNVQEEALAES